MFLMFQRFINQTPARGKIPSLIIYILKFQRFTGHTPARGAYPQTAF